MIEVVVAFLLLSLALGVLLGALTIGLRNSGRAAQSGLALLHAQSLLAETGISVALEEGETSGRSPDGFAWRRVILRQKGKTASPVTAFAVRISVTPPDDGAPVSLSTLRLSDTPAPELSTR